MIPYFTDLKILRSFAVIASKVNEKAKKSNIKIIKATTKEEWERTYDLLKPMLEFSQRTNNKKEFMKAKMETLNTGSIYYIEEGDKVISTASATDVTMNYILVHMVGTAEEARGKGLATIIINHLMIDYIEKRNKSIFLFYDYLF